MPLPNLGRASLGTNAQAAVVAVPTHQRRFPRGYVARREEKAGLAVPDGFWNAADPTCEHRDGARGCFEDREG
jgi:hypothetical protein